MGERNKTIKKRERNKTLKKELFRSTLLSIFIFAFYETLFLCIAFFLILILIL